MILQEFIQKISERMSEVRGGTRRSRLFVGVALCVALFAFVGCPDAGNPGGVPDGGPDAGTPDTAPPVITLMMGNSVIVLDIGDTFTDPGFDVNDDDPNYTGMVTPTITDSGGTEVSANTLTAAAGIYTITYTAPADAADNTPETVTRTVRVGADADGNNRIDINFLEDLDAVRTDLTGTVAQCGTDGTTACEGYELTRDLDFADGDSYTDGTVNADWRPDATDPDSATNEGWNPIGTGTGVASFSGSFFGNGFVISNLYARRSGNVGLFGVNTGAIERIGVVDGNIYGGAGRFNAVGGLIGTNSGTITASYATGDADGGTGFDDVGGLVGNNTGTITASYATGNVDGGTGGFDDVGGLVGESTGTIMASYATGNADGEAGDNDHIGGLLGLDTGATITATYATGNANRQDLDTGSAGGLIGLTPDHITRSSIASYGFGSAPGNPGFRTIRSTDASDATAVPNPCALTQANSSTEAGNDWDADQWDFGTAMQRPIVLHDGVAVRGQEDRRC